MKCIECGRGFTPSGHGSPSKYCSAKCRMRSYRRRKRNGETATPKRNAQPKPPTSAAEPTGIDKHEFDRMMDGSMEDALRYVRDRLKKALDDPATPPNSLAAISLRYLDACARLDDLAGGDLLTGGLDDETMEVNEDAGASIV